MERNLSGHLKEWFAAYCRGFYTENMADNRNIALKEEHTRIVCENMNLLTNGLALDDNDRATAQAIALFHDLGRFEQYRRYSTFRDACRGCRDRRATAIPPRSRLSCAARFSLQQADSL